MARTAEEEEWMKMTEATLSILAESTARLDVLRARGFDDKTAANLMASWLQVEIQMLEDKEKS